MASQFAAKARGCYWRLFLRPPPFLPSSFFPGSSFAFSSFSFSSVGLVSGPDPVQYLSLGSAICSHFHMFNIHISCLLPCPIVVTGSFSFHLSPIQSHWTPQFCCISLVPPGEYWGLQPRAMTMPTPHLHLQPLPHTLTWGIHTLSSRPWNSPLCLSFIPSSCPFFLLATEY